MDGTAIVEALPSPECNRPRTDGGLDRNDLEDLADVVEVLVRTRTDLTDEERKNRLLGIDNIRAMLHYRFDRSCDHGWACQQKRGRDRRSQRAPGE